jgi:tetratricopeptide (TPR) repeat protein
LGEYSVARDKYHRSLVLSKNNKEYMLHNAINNLYFESYEDSKNILEELASYYNLTDSKNSGEFSSIALYGLGTYWLLKENYRKAEELLSKSVSYIHMSMLKDVMNSMYKNKKQDNVEDLKSWYGLEADIIAKRAYALMKMKEKYSAYVSLLLAENENYGYEIYQKGKTLYYNSIHYDNNLNKEMALLNIHIAELLGYPGQRI